MNAVLKLQRGPHIVSAIEATYLLTIACIVINAIVVLWTRTLLLINVLCFIYIAYASSWWTLQFMLASTNLIRIMLRCGFIRYFAVTAAQIILQFFSTFLLCVIGQALVIGAYLMESIYFCVMVFCWTAWSVLYSCACCCCWCVSVHAHQQWSKRDCIVVACACACVS